MRRAGFVSHFPSSFLTLTVQGSWMKSWMRSGVDILSMSRY